MNSHPENVSDRPMIRYDKAHKVRKHRSLAPPARQLFTPKVLPCLSVMLWLS
jgi:hypothetical protein